MTTTDTKPPEPKGAPWHAILPQPESIVKTMGPAELAEMIRSSHLTPGKDYLVVDVRRTDFENSFIKGALNLPAHSFYQTLPTIVTILSTIPKVIFHCNSCSPGGRGPRTAGWYSDELKRRGLSPDGVLVLEGGLKSWLASYASDADITVTLPAT